MASMKGILMKKEGTNELFLLVGRVKATNEASSTKYEVSVEYDEFNAATRQNEPMVTTLVFQDASNENAEGKAPQWAYYAKRMKLREGSVICTMVRFNDDAHKKANAYTCRYNGVIPVRPNKGDTEQGERNCVGGLVTWLKDRIDRNNKSYVSMGVYVGKDQDGKMHSVVINARNDKMMERCKKALSPREDGRKMYAWFACFEAYEFFDDDLEAHYVYTAFDFTITGSKDARPNES